MWILTIVLLAQTALAHSIDTSLATRNTLLAKRALCEKDIKCILNAEVMEGPFYVAEPLVRSDLVEDRAGAPLDLTIQVLDVRSCEAAPDLWVDIWHADADGVYSGWASDENLLALPSFPSTSQEDSFDYDFADSLKSLRKRGTPHESSRWLRGVQRTDKHGRVTFKTIVPGWYYGRCDHIHVRVHSTNATVQDGHLLGGTVSHTGQIFFEDDLIDQLRDRENGMAPYNLRTDVPRKNMEDELYRYERGSEQLVSIQRQSTSIGDGFRGDIIIGVDPSVVQPPSRMPGGPGHGGPGGPGHGGPGRGGRTGPGGHDGYVDRNLVTLVSAVVVAALGAGVYVYRKRRATGQIQLQ